MASTTWQIDPSHTGIEFAVKHMMISTVKGTFSDVSGTIVMDEADPSGSSVDVEIGAASIDTREEQRDEHLRTGDFLDVENHPKITFKSRRVEADGANGLRVVGDLTIRGVTQEVVLEATHEGQATDPWGNEKAGFTATTAIDRRDFGLTWNAALETGGVLVGHEVRINLELQAAKVEPASA